MPCTHTKQMQMRQSTKAAISAHLSRGKEIPQVNNNQYPIPRYLRTLSFAPAIPKNWSVLKVVSHCTSYTSLWTATSPTVREASQSHHHDAKTISATLTVPTRIGILDISPQLQSQCREARLPLFLSCSVSNFRTAHDRVVVAGKRTRNFTSSVKSDSSRADLSREGAALAIQEQRFREREMMVAKREEEMSRSEAELRLKERRVVRRERTVTKSGDKVLRGHRGSIGDA
jgi:hypothetical protein